MTDVERLVLANGLRVVVLPDRFCATVGISVHVGVGFRTEPAGRSGFAHLFEHLMFEGSDRVPAGAHGRIVQRAGGSFNGSTGPDLTTFHQEVPLPALEQALFCEADRLRAPTLSAAGLARQLAVVKDEIRRARSRPYGQFPWPLITQALYSGWADTHDGYGDFADLDNAGVDDCRDFFDRYYRPANTVLAVVGDVTTDQIRDLTERHFAGIAARPGADAGGAREPAPGTLDTEWADQYAPGPALTLGWRLPDPATRLPEYLAHMLLSTVLTNGVTSRLHRGLNAAGLGDVTIRSMCGLVGGPLRAHAPDTFTVTAYHPATVTPGRIKQLVGDALDEVSTIGADEVRGAAARTAAAWSRAHLQPGQRARALGRLEALFGAGELAASVPHQLLTLGPAAVAAAAQRLRDTRPAAVRVVPTARQAAVPDAPAAKTTTPQTPQAVRGLPALGPARPVRLPATTSRTLGNGLRVVAVRLPSVPLISARLRLPVSGADPAAAVVCGAMLLREDRYAPVGDLEAAGWTLVPLIDTRQITLSANGPAAELGALLHTLAGALTRPGGYGPTEVRTARDLIGQQITAASAQPAALARTALRTLGGWPAEQADPAGFAAVGAETVERFHRTRLVPRGATLVLAGDLDPDRAVDQVAAAFDGWTDQGPRPSGTPGPWTPAQPWLTIDRPGAAQAQLRFATAGPGPADPGFAAFDVAVTAFGGYAGARLPARLRNELRWTYSARAALEPENGHSAATVAFDVRRDVAAAAIGEFHQLVAGLQHHPFTTDECAAARDYLLGRTTAGLDSPDGLAAALTGTLALGQSPTDLYATGARLAAVRTDDIVEASLSHLTATTFAGIGVGDAAHLTPALTH